MLGGVRQGTKQGAKCVQEMGQDGLQAQIKGR